MTEGLILHDYWRSGAGYRVRIALNLKGLAYQRVTHDLRTGAQSAPSFVSKAPQGLVPALEAHGQIFTQSLAMIEWLEETYPEPPLLPRAPQARAVVRAMAHIVACDTHPLNNLRVLKTLETDLGAGPDERSRWISRWITDGFHALERLALDHGGTYLFGDQPSLADCCLVPQVYSARRFEVDLSAFPKLVQIEQTASLHPAFRAAAPARQSDCD